MDAGVSHHPSLAGPRLPCAASAATACRGAGGHSQEQKRRQPVLMSASKAPPPLSDPVQPPPPPPCFPSSTEAPGAGLSWQSSACTSTPRCDSCAQGTHLPATAPAPAAAFMSPLCPMPFPWLWWEKLGPGGRAHSCSAQPPAGTDPSFAESLQHPSACSLKPCDSSTATRFSSTLSSSLNVAFPGITWAFSAAITHLRVQLFPPRRVPYSPPLLEKHPLPT